MVRVLLLLPSATYRAEGFLEAARAIGAEVIVASERRQALAGLMSGRALQLDLRRPEAAAEAIVARARTLPLDAVVAVDDQGVLAAALAAEALGLPHNPPGAVAATRDKGAMRSLAGAAGIPQPTWALVGPAADIGAAARRVGLPCVVKPLALSGSRGVIRADDAPSAVRAGERIRQILAAAGEDPSGQLLVESYVPGAEVAVEGLLRGGRLEVLAIFDKPDPLEGPYFEETIYVTPSRLPEAAQSAVRRLVADTVAAIGLREGPIHAEARVDDGQVRLLEVAARSIGGLCARALRFGLGVTLEEVILRHAAGLPLPDLAREDRASGVMMLPIPRAGVLAEVGGQDAAREVAGIAGLQITVAPGRPVRPLPEGDRYLGFLFARADRPDDVERALRQAHARLDVVIDDAEPGAEAASGRECR